MTTSRTVEVDGDVVGVLEGGTGPTVLLLHGSGPGTTGAGAWATTARALAPDHHVVAPDQAGFGRTPLPPGSRGGLAVWAEQAGALMDTLGVGTFAVVGHSMGGAVSLALAAARPRQVTHVVAVGTMGAPGAPLSDDLDALWAATPDSGGARDMLARLFHDPALVTDAAVAARARAMRAGATTYASMFPPPRSRWSDDLTLSPSTLSQVRAPVLLLHGAEDRVTPLSGALPLLDHLPDVSLRVTPGCGHALPAERPEEFLTALRSFLPGGAPSPS